MPTARRLTSLAILAAACSRTPRLAVPAGGPITVDGELTEPPWRQAARAGRFIDLKTNAAAAPYSEARLLHDADHLYLGLYAADEDIHSTEAFVVEANGHHWRFTAAGTIDPAIPGAQIAVDRDGTMDDPRDLDEEWVVEASIPLTAIPGEGKQPITLRLSRCDDPRNGAHVCGELLRVIELR
jgi:hypothetical protein